MSRFKFVGFSLAVLAVLYAVSLPAGENATGRKQVELILVELENFRLLTYANGEPVTSYPISIGKDTAPTPLGEYKITAKLKNPWYTPDDEPAQPPGDEENPIGSRWLSINKPSYGIHGTNEPRRMREKISDGCIRMRNKHVNQLYSRVRQGTQVIIREKFENESLTRLASQDES